MPPFFCGSLPVKVRSLETAAGTFFLNHFFSLSRFQ